MMSRQDVPRRVTQIVGRPARWASPNLSAGSYDGCERTLDIFDVPPGEQLGLLRALRAERPSLQRAAGGPLVIVFHTPGETRRLYPDVLSESSLRRLRHGELADALDRWMTRDHSGEPAVGPDEIKPFTFQSDKEAA